MTSFKLSDMLDTWRTDYEILFDVSLVEMTDTASLTKRPLLLSLF
jgi:hypothetical protein